jgi:hypothetical protein
MDKGAYVNSQVTCAMIEALGMQAENERRKFNGESPIYIETDFQILIQKYGIGCNDVLQYLQE